MAHKADNDNEFGSDKSNDAQGVIEIISTGLRGRTNLFALALETRKVMIETQVQLKQFSSRRKSAEAAERRLIDREMRGLVSKHRDAGRRLVAIEDAMAPEMRVNLWRLIDLDDGWQ